MSKTKIDMEAGELIRELKIGNYVLYKGSIVAWDCDDFSEVEKGIMDFVQPIPLTEEWLLKAGFEKKGGYNEMKKSNFKLTALVRVVSTNELRAFHHKIAGHIGFVHQLQNLFWCLCGKELELKE